MDRGQFVEHLCRKASEVGGQKILARKLGVSETYLSDVINGRRDPADRLLSALGMERVVTYRFIEKQ